MTTKTNQGNNSEDYSDIEKYIGDSNIIDKIRDLKDSKKQYSDILDNDCHQYVDLVQEGGGTLGISLVGFCFVLEYIGIRFLRLAGTSAGAINTLFLAALGENKAEAVTPQLFNIINKMDMFSFVDGHWLSKAIIKSVISKDNWFLGTVITYIIIAFLLIFYFPFIISYTAIGQFIYKLFFMLFLLFTALIAYMYLRFKKANYGINPGAKFEFFLEDKLENIGIKNQSDLDAKAKFDVNNYKDINFRFRENKETELIANNNKLEKLKERFNDYIGIPLEPIDKEETSTDIYTAEVKIKHNEAIEKFEKDFNKFDGSLEGLKADYTFVTIDIASEKKVELPLNADLYWSNPPDVNPAKYVRASMSIPVFFEPLILPIKKENNNIQKAWKKIFIHSGKIPHKAIFVDGGAISNFPINIFHNPNVITPRMPIIGIRINDTKKENNIEINNFFQYLGKIFNTMKSNHDKDFLSKNSFYEKHSIADINTYETKANWLDFNMSEENKKALFLKGVESAIKFLENFDWKSYKEDREKVYFENLNKNS
jgi:NTE family protein